MPDIRTPEGREELRQEALEEIALGAVGFCYDIPVALDGLDIAESYFQAKAEREAHFDCYPCFKLDHSCPVAEKIENRMTEALTKWNNWQRVDRP